MSSTALMVREVSCQMWLAFSCAVNGQSSVPLKKRILWVITALWDLTPGLLPVTWLQDLCFMGVAPPEGYPGSSWQLAAHLLDLPVYIYPLYKKVQNTFLSLTHRSLS